jgi:hypothetical protein
MAGISSDMARLPSISASHEHFEARLAVIRSQLSRVEKPIIVMGDSIVESALLPPSLCGHPIINAGVGGATIGFFCPLRFDHCERCQSNAFDFGGWNQ